MEQNRDNPKYKWINDKRLSKGGLRIFQEEHSGRWAIADNSGQYPHQTEDGVCWIDTTRCVSVRLTGIDIPVILARDINGSGCRTGDTLAGAVVLKAAGIPGLMFVLNDEAQAAHKVFHELVSP